MECKKTKVGGHSIPAYSIDRTVSFGCLWGCFYVKRWFGANRRDGGILHGEWCDRVGEGEWGTLHWIAPHSLSFPLGGPDHMHQRCTTGSQWADRRDWVCHSNAALPASWGFKSLSAPEACKVGVKGKEMQRTMQLSPHPLCQLVVWMDSLQRMLCSCFMFPQALYNGLSRKTWWIKIGGERKQKKKKTKTREDTEDKCDSSKMVSKYYVLNWLRHCAPCSLLSSST